jgi:hypothetical protein
MAQRLMLKGRCAGLAAQNQIPALFQLNDRVSLFAAWAMLFIVLHEKTYSDSDG